MTALLYPVLAIALATGGCATARPDASEPPDSQTAALEAVPTGEVRIALGESVAVDGVAVRFARVAEDSRCPPDVSCVWAGRAHVELVVGGATHVLSVPGYGTDDTPAEATAGGLTVRVTALAGPAPSAAGEPLAMWVELDVTRASGSSTGQ